MLWHWYSATGLLRASCYTVWILLVVEPGPLFTCLLGSSFAVWIKDGHACLILWIFPRIFLQILFGMHYKIGPGFVQNPRALILDGWKLNMPNISDFACLSETSRDHRSWQALDHIRSLGEHPRDFRLWELHIDVLLSNIMMLFGVFDIVCSM